MILKIEPKNAPAAEESPVTTHLISVFVKSTLPLVAIK